MGVVHKFKPEVIDFILAQKKDNPKLSCRKLAEIVNEKFQLKASKSSVNTILKNAQMSNPVGRPSGHEDKPQFKIPDAKKEELLKEVQSAQEIQETKPIPQKEEVPPQKPEEKPGEQLEQQPIEQITESQQNDLPFPAGWFFLKAAEQELSPDPLLYEVLKERFPDYSADTLKSAVNDVLYAEFISDGDSRREMARFSGLPSVDSSVTARIKQVIEEQSESFLASLHQTMHYAFTRVHTIEVLLGDNSKIYFGPRLDMISLEKTPSADAAPVKTTLQRVSQQLISNIHPLIVLYADMDLTDVWAALQNKPDKNIKKVALLDENGESLFEYDQIPPFKRRAIFGASPWQSNYADVLKDVAPPEDPIKVPVIEQELFYIEKMSNLNENETIIRTIAISDSNKGPISMVLLSNFLPKERSAQDIILDFFNKCPICSIPNRQEMDQNRTISCDIYNYGDFKSAKTPQEGISRVFEALEAYNRTYLLPKSLGKASLDEIKGFYQIRAKTVDQGSSINIDTVYPDTYQYKDELGQAIGCFNALFGKNFFPKPIFFKKIHT